jgi:hypothetical protein
VSSDGQKTGKSAEIDKLQQLGDQTNSENIFGHNNNQLNVDAVASTMVFVNSNNNEQPVGSVDGGGAVSAQNYFVNAPSVGQNMGNPIDQLSNNMELVSFNYVCKRKFFFFNSNFW